METDSSSNSLIQNWFQLDTKKSEPESKDDNEGSSPCDLTIKELDDPTSNHPEKPIFETPDEELDFGSNLPKNKICCAEDVFYQGQILPLRLVSVSCSGSEPMSASSSRSSSNRSNDSGTSATSGSEFLGYKPRNEHLNIFHSHPSLKPQIRSRSFGYSNMRSSSKWSLLQLGPLKPKEIGLTDLKNRRERSMKDQNKMVKKKTKNQTLLFGGCKCSTNVVESAVSSRSPMVKPTQETKLSCSKQCNVGQRKHALSVSLSSQPTSQWLNQHSIQQNYYSR